MRYYVSKCHNRLNSSDYSPETITPFLCLNPYYNVSLKPGCKVHYMIDSGAFQDVSTNSRLSFKDALKRQLDFEEKIGQISECLVSYDRLVDEQVNEKGQFKKRVDFDISKDYVSETIDAARYLSEQRSQLAPRKLILSCQGTTVKQYLECMESILDFAQPGDIIGLGGFCILSKSIEYEKQFYSIIKDAFPMIQNAGIDRVHIFGMGIFRALVQTDFYARINSIHCSYDTSSPEMNSVFGKCFSPVDGQMKSVFSKIHKHNGYEPADLSLFNIKMIKIYWEEISKMPVHPDFIPGIVKRG